ncbi:MAG: hypothetical protein HN729_10355 [Candidatus Marinimicrobia bacterium]|nr:hypothetical protein [Candidatus Neomarinimicrobiota bacterium]MBT3683075.1 hypothetical protein [Candidatus Neomarinimicrobiota bacterium]MBT3759833.1 hypothetical protein [Candidatus Neomarinimicrobiota bacterium]MBT3895714.1 hypothetical protein [Candidatus Neomarinimicrobiota bacterium]MBT4537819.1 hypothetical protein [Candidatus Neomarinimicrobiota bacterium]
MPEPGTGNIYSDPLFTELSLLDFSLNIDSPCIDAGDPFEFDPDDTVCDIGAIFFSQEVQQSGDCNEDGWINVMDIVVLINSCILAVDNLEDCITCGDMNSDETVDVLDIIIILNWIISE